MTERIQLASLVVLVVVALELGVLIIRPSANASGSAGTADSLNAICRQIDSIRTDIADYAGRQAIYQAC